MHTTQPQFYLIYDKTLADKSSQQGAAWFTHVEFNGAAAYNLRRGLTHTAPYRSPCALASCQWRIVHCGENQPRQQPICAEGWRTRLPTGRRVLSHRANGASCIAAEINRDSNQFAQRADAHGSIPVAVFSRVVPMAHRALRRKSTEAATNLRRGLTHTAPYRSPCALASCQ